MGDGNGGQLVTLFEAKELMLKMLTEYERDVVNPRHLETQGDLADIKKIVLRRSNT